MAKATSPRQSKPSTFRRIVHWLRLTAIGLLVGLSCLALTLFTAVHWVERQVLTPDNWVSMVTPWPKQPVIYQALGTYITDQLFSAVPVQQEIADALPPKAGFLAKPLTDQLNSLVEKTAQRTVASDTFQTIWVAANRVAINRIVSIGRDPESTPPTIKIRNQTFQLDLSNSNGVLRQKLGNVAPALFNNPQTAQKHVNITASLKSSREKVRLYVRSMDFLNKVLPVLTITCLLGALALTQRARRRVVMVFASIVGGLALLQLIGVKALRPELLNQVQHASFKPSVGYIYDQLVASFNHVVYWALAVAVVTIIICLLAGPTAWARKLRSFVRLDKVQSSQPMQWWRKARQWTAKYKLYVWLALTIITLLYLAFVATVNWRVGTNSVLVLLAGIATVYIFGSAPAKAAQKR